MQLPGTPNLTVGSIFAIGRNYAEHAKELNNEIPQEPVVFLKSRNAFRTLADTGMLGHRDEEFHHEAEIVVCIGEKIPRGTPFAWDQVCGLALGLDLTRRGKQNELKKAGLPWTVAKSFDGAAVVSDFLPLNLFSSPTQWKFSLLVNGVERQRGNSQDMLFPIPVICAHLLAANTLHPGDIIFTGTPSGVGPIRAGDSIKLTWLSEKFTFAGIL